MTPIPSDRCTGEKAVSPDRWRPGWWLWAVVAGGMLGGDGLSMARAQGYLSVVGPPSLRFRPAKVTPAASFVLPPLTMSGAEAMAAAQAGTAGATEAPAGEAVAVSDPADSKPTERSSTAMLPEVPSSAEPAGAMPTTHLVETVAASGPDALSLYPQYFLRYFESTGTNRVGTTVVTPYRFIPPEPVVRGESRATYRVQPHP